MLQWLFSVNSFLHLLVPTSLDDDLFVAEIVSGGVPRCGVL